MDIYNINGIKLESDFVRICALNVGNFSMGEYGNPHGTNAMYENFMKTFIECNPNIYLFSEWDINYNQNKTSLDTFGFLKRFHFNYIKTGDGIYAGQMIYSDYEIKNQFHKDFIINPPYYFIDCTTYINCKLVHLISCHFTGRTEGRRAQIREILNYITTNNIEYYIIGGDMNLGLHTGDDQPQTQELKIQIAREDINLFESIGCHSLQGSSWGKPSLDGFFNTAGTGVMYADWVNCFDNIVVSNNIFVKNVNVIVTEASDHNALIADLIIM